MGHGAHSKENLLLHARPELLQEITDHEDNLRFNIEKLSIGSSKKLWWRSQTCGHIFFCSVATRVGMRSSCLYCCGQRVLPGFNDLATTHPLLAKEWSKTNSLTPESVVAGSHKRILWLCSEGHSWEAEVYSRAHKGNNCGVCSNRVIQKGVNDFYTRLSEKVKEEWSNENKISLKRAAQGDLKKDFKWSCKKCTHSWLASLTQRGAGWHRCIKCYGKSQLEAEVAVFLDESNIRYERNMRPLQALDASGKMRRYELDFILRDFPIAIEVQDNSTHSKTKDDDMLFGRWLANAQQRQESLFKKGPTYHILKKRLADEQLSIKLIELWEDQIRSGLYKSILQEVLKELRNV